MSRRVQLPTETDVAAALTQLCDHADQHHTRPTVTALARRVGLTNATFWRCFPQQARELVERARVEPTDADNDRGTNVTDRTAALARDNQQLREHLDLATANIARLTLENHHLRTTLEAATSVSQLSSRHP